MPNFGVPERGRAFRVPSVKGISRPVDPASAAIPQLSELRLTRGQRGHGLNYPGDARQLAHLNLRV